MSDRFVDVTEKARELRVLYQDDPKAAAAAIGVNRTQVGRWWGKLDDEEPVNIRRENVPGLERAIALRRPGPEGEQFARGVEAAVEEMEGVLAGLRQRVRPATPKDGDPNTGSLEDGLGDLEEGGDEDDDDAA